MTHCTSVCADRPRAGTAPWPLLALIGAVGALVAGFVLFAVHSQHEVFHRFMEQQLLAELHGRQQVLSRRVGRLASAADPAPLLDVLAHAEYDGSATPWADEFWPTEFSSVPAAVAAPGVGQGPGALPWGDTPRSAHGLFLIDGEGALLYGGTGAAAAADATAPAGLAELVARARKAGGGEASAPVGGLILLDGVPHLAAAQRLSAFSDPTETGAAPVLAMTVSLQATVLPALGHAHGWTVALLPPTQDTAPSERWPERTPLVALDGQPLGTVVWNARLPGAEFLQAGLPPLVVGMLLMGGLAVALARRMQATASRLSETLAVLEDRNAQLAVSESRHETLARVVPVGIFLTDSDGRTLYLNDRFAALAGGSQLAEQRRDWVTLVHPDERPGIAMQWRAAVEQSCLFQAETRLVGGGGEQWVRVEAVPQVMPGERMVGYVGSITDLSESKRTADQLLTARREAERANCAKSRFLAAASHDLRQPLHALGLFLSVLSQGNHSPWHRELIERIEQSLKSTDELLTVLLDISRLDAGVVAPQRESVALADLLTRLRQQFSLEAAGRRLDLRVLPRDLYVDSDPTLLERILRNLVSNALRYTQEGRVLVGCRVHGAMVRVEVWDTGIGIPEDQLSNIFEEFYQLDNSERDRRRGLGLGLAIVARLSELLRHPVDVRSLPTKGSMFSVTVPLVPAPHAAPDLAELPPLRAVGGALIAVIDDEPDVLKAMRLFLEANGCQVLTAETADDALTQITGAGTLPDLIIADFRLRAGATGTEAIRSICRRLGHTIPAVIMTGDTSPSRVREAAASGFALLHKPVDGQILLAEIQRHTVRAPVPA